MEMGRPSAPGGGRSHTGSTGQRPRFCQNPRRSDRPGVPAGVTARHAVPLRARARVAGACARPARAL